MQLGLADRLVGITIIGARGAKDRVECGVIERLAHGDNLLTVREVKRGGDRQTARTSVTSGT